MSSDYNRNILQQLNVLYVEDEEDLLEITVDSLRFLVKNIEGANNGQQGLDIFKKYYKDENLPNFDIVITDINMPIMDGLEMLYAIKEIDKNISMVVTTAHTDANFLKQSIDLGVSGYVMKPIDMFKFYDTIVTAVESNVLKRKLEDKIDDQYFKIRTILDSQDNFIIVSDGEKITDCNKSFLDFLNIKSCEELQQTISCVDELFLKDEDDDYLNIVKTNTNWLNRLGNSDKQEIVKIHNRNFDISEIFQISVNKISSHNNDMEYVITLNNVTELHSKSKQLEFKATHDFLTQINNRQYFNNILKEEILRVNRYNNNLSLIMFDIDHFKVINDTFGHETGDTVLIELTRLVRVYLRNSDLFARYGGEEFMILLRESTKENAFKVANKLREKIEEYQILKDKNHKVTCSFGVTEFIKTETDKSFIKRVDEALYEAKESGRNKVVLK